MVGMSAGGTDREAPGLGAAPTEAGAEVGTAETFAHGPTLGPDGEATPTPAPPRAAPPPSVPGGLAPGELLAGRYRVRALLGKGGMGVVYLVDDLELDEEVALKLLRRELSADAAYRQRLRSEVRLARRVSHPNVCRVHDLGQHEDHLFVTMERVPGRTLRAVMRDMQAGVEPPMSLARVVDLIGQLCAALSAAHRVGVLHRDVKPDNVIVEDGRAVLTDFGVASLASEGSRVIAGTPAYVAPEVLRGEPFDARSDVYAAAVVAFELFAGRVPFAPRTMDEAAQRALARPPAPPLPAAVGGSALRAALERVLAAALDADPARRLPSVDRLAEGLARALGEADDTGDAALAPVRVVEAALSQATAGTPPTPSALPSSPATPTTGPLAAMRRAEARVATALVFRAPPPGPAPAPPPPPASAAEASSSDGTVVLDLALALPGDDLERVVVGLGGTPLVSTERSIIALFGAPVALGDDAVRAVRAARALVERTGGHAGLDTARVMLRPGALDLAAADVVRAAEALAGAAPAGEVWLGGAAARQVAALIDVAPVTTVGELAGGRALRVTGEAPQAGGDAGAVVARPRELARLEAIARACFETRVPTFVELRGPAGSGKSRLREAFVARVAERREVDWLIGRAAPLGEAAPLSLLRSADPAWPAAIEAAQRPGTADRAATLAEARRWVEARARRRPVAIVLEDLQWADELSRAVIAHLAAELRDGPILVLGVARDDAAAPPPGAEALALGPLDDDVAARLARAIAPDAGDDAIAALVARAGGSPFFVEELARERASQVGGAAASLPPTIEAALQARLDRLSPRAADALAAAAVVGRACWREAVREAMPTPPGDAELDDALAELERRGLIRPTPPATPLVIDDERYELTQALVRDVAYGRIAPRERRRAHAQVARWLEKKTGGVRATDPDVLLALAHHREAGGDDAGAAAAWRAAAARCLELYAYGQALAAARRAVELGELSGGAVDAAALELWGDAAMMADTTAAAVAAFDRALAATPETTATTTARARLWHKLGLAHSAHADHARAIACHERGLALVAPGDVLSAEAARDPRLAAALYASLGWVLAYQLSSSDPRGLALCERACALLEPTPHRRELAKALSRLGGAYMRAGRWHDQRRCNQRNLEIAEELGDLAAQLTARTNLGVVLANLGEVDAAIEHTERALALCRKTGSRIAEGLVLSNLAGYLIERGELAAAERRLGDAIGLLERTGSRRVLPEAYLWLARARARRGELDGAATAATTSAEVSRELGVAFEEAIARRALAQIEARRGRPEAAAAELAAAERLFGDGGDPVEEARLELARARVRGWDAPEGVAARARARAVLAPLGAALDLRSADDPHDVR